MNDRHHPEDVNAVLQALDAFTARCDELMLILDEKPRLSAAGRERAQGLYRSLKEDLKAAAKAPYVHPVRGKRPLTPCESAFYEPAVKRAAIDLRPATNSNPLSSQWFGAVYEAQMEFTYYAHNLRDAISKK